MIFPKTSVEPENVAAHYDELDAFYRDVWGDHVHHGLWRSGREGTDSAVRQLVALVADKGRVTNASVCDVGCGYGATSRMLATDYHAAVTALTVSGKQFEYARGVDAAATNPMYLLQDWLANQLPDESFDTVIAIESLAHMTDKRRFFCEAGRVLRPGGRLVVCAWLAREDPRPWEIRLLLEPICREGRLPGMGSAAEYQQVMESAGFVLDEFEDLTRQVRKTWSVCISRTFQGFLFKREYRRMLFDRMEQSRVFARTLFRIWLAYRTGSMRYGLFVATKP